MIETMEQLEIECQRIVREGDSCVKCGGAIKDVEGARYYLLFDGHCKECCMSAKRAAELRN